MDPRIGDYIRDNREKYTREAMREQLIAAGHDPTAVDAELDRSVTASAQPVTRGTVATYVWTVFAIGAGVILAFTVMGFGFLGLAWLLAYGLIGFFVARGLSRISSPASPLGWVGVILFAPIAFLLIGGTICAATLFLVLNSLST